ncbi:MAG: hypothetical protein ACKOD9_00575, partial [Rubrivivax sp.]
MSTLPCRRLHVLPTCHVTWQQQRAPYGLLFGTGVFEMTPASPSPAQVRRGLLLGFVGVVIFAMTFPMTRLAVGDASAPQMSPAFVTAARAALAGLLSIFYLRWVGASVPERRYWAPLAVCAAGTVVG